jgi:hypothetical protein
VGIEKVSFVVIPEDAKCIPISKRTFIEHPTRRYPIKSREIEFFNSHSHFTSDLETGTGARLQT